MAEEGFGDQLTKEVGGVPVWAIGTGIGAVVIIGAFFLKGRGTSGTTQTVYSSDDLQPEEGDPSNADLGLPDGPIGDWLRDNPGYAGYPVGSSPRGLPSAITNAQWARQVHDWFASTGADLAIVSNALTKYLSQQSLSAAEKAVITLALQIIGSPPEGILPITETPPPPTTGNYTGPATAKAQPEGGGEYDPKKKGWWTKVVHSNWTATYRGGYNNLPPRGSAQELAQLAQLQARNATHPHRSGGTIFLPDKLG